MKFWSDSMMLSNSGTAKAADEFSPQPLLNAFENFRGSFFDLDRRVETSADDLKRLRTPLRAEIEREGLGAGDVVLVALQNGVLFAAALAACLEAGACPLLVHGETPGPELDRIATRWKTKFLIAEAESSEGRRPLLPLSSQHILRWERRESGATSLRLTAVPLHPTSGTTGGPKIAVRPGPCAVAEPLHYIETLAIDKSDTILCAVPMSHAYAYGMCLLVTLLTSARLVFMRRFAPDVTRAALDDMRISIFPAVPVMLDSLLTLRNGLRHRPRIVLSAGAPLSRETFDAFRRKFGISIRPLYGTTETGGISIADPEEEFSGSVGAPMRGVEVALAHGRNTEDVRAVRVRSSSMMAGYLEGDAVSREAIQDGWFETGDFARVDERGKIFLRGRLSEVINVFGYKVIPKEVEDVILLLPEVAEVKVYAGKHLGPDIVQAAVVCRDRISEAEIMRHCEKHLVSHKCPTAVRFVESLPRTATGKVDVESLVRSDVQGAWER